MTREEAIKVLTEINYNSIENDTVVATHMAIKALKQNESAEEWYKLFVEKLEQEQEPKTGQFAKWVANEIFDENWEYNKDAFEELACRKLAKLGIVRAKGDEWELVEPQESEEV